MHGTDHDNEMCGLSDKQRESLKQRHRDSFQRHGYGVESLFWSSRGIQKVRFQALADAGIQAGDSVLDVGCGFADLAGWFAGESIPVRYTGIDLSPEILAAARRRTPELELYCGELFNFEWPAQHFDWVLLSGTLNWQLHDHGAYARQVIARMFSLCRRGVAFNMLDARALHAHLLGDLTSHDPLQMLSFCKSLTANVALRDDYLENDFTIYMRR